MLLVSDIRAGVRLVRYVQQKHGFWQGQPDVGVRESRKIVTFGNASNRANALGLSGFLGGHVKFVVQELRGEVGTIRPRDCAKVWQNGEAAEVRWIAERLEYWTLKVCRKINLARFSVLEFDRVITDVPSFHYINHRPTPTARLPWAGAPPAPFDSMSDMTYDRVGNGETARMAKR